MVATQSIRLVFEYIGKHNQNATKSAVVDFMQNHVEEKYKISRDTTRKLIELMESRGIIKISKPERPGMPHYLSINEDNHFNQIFKAYTAIDRIIDNMEKPLTEFKSLAKQHASNHSGSTQQGCYDCKMMRNLLVGFLRDYEDLVVVTLDVLLLQAYESSITRDDKLGLYDSILSVKVKCLRQMNFVGPRGIDIDINTSLTDQDKEYAKRHGISFDSMPKEYKEMIESCKVLTANRRSTIFNPSTLTKRVEYL